MAHVTPTMNRLVADGINISHHYVFKYCSPTRTAIQSGRAPFHVNVLNCPPTYYNPAEPTSGCVNTPQQTSALRPIGDDCVYSYGCVTSAAGMARNMTGMAMKMSAAGYITHYFGKWVRQSLGIATVHAFAAAIAGVRLLRPFWCHVGRRNGNTRPHSSWSGILDGSQLL